MANSTITPEITLFQLNLLAEGLKSDGFLGLGTDQIGRIPLKTDDDQYIDEVKMLKNNLLTEKKKDEFKEEYNLLREASKFEKEDGSIDFKLPILTIPEQVLNDIIEICINESGGGLKNISDLLNITKKLFDKYCFSKASKKVYKEKYAQKSHNSIYTFMQKLLTVHDDNGKKKGGLFIEGGKSSAFDLTEESINNRGNKFGRMISANMPDIVCLQEDDFSFEFMPKGYTCILGGSRIIKERQQIEGRFKWEKICHGIDNEGREPVSRFKVSDIKSMTFEGYCSSGDLKYNRDEYARAFKPNSSGVKNTGAKFHDGTTIWWNTKKIECSEITVFNINPLSEDKKKNGEQAVKCLFNRIDDKDKKHQFVIISTHLSSGRDKPKDRQNEWSKLVPMIPSNMPFIISGDFNEDPNYGFHKNDIKGTNLFTKITGSMPVELDQKKYDRDTEEYYKHNLYPNQTHASDHLPQFYKFKVDMSKQPIYTFWDGEKGVLPKEFAKNVSNRSTVSKIRGPGSAQPSKVLEYEHQWIDWNFGKFINFNKINLKTGADDDNNLTFLEYKSEINSPSDVIPKGTVSRLTGVFGGSYLKKKNTKKQNTRKGRTKKHRSKKQKPRKVRTKKHGSKSNKKKKTHTKK